MSSFKVGTSLVGSIDTLNGSDAPPVVIVVPSVNLKARAGVYSSTAQSGVYSASVGVSHSATVSTNTMG